MFQKKFPLWEAGKSFIVKVIYFIQEIFNNPNYFKDNSKISNEEKGKIEFDPEIKKFTRISFDERFENKNRFRRSTEKNQQT